MENLVEGMQQQQLDSVFLRLHKGKIWGCLWGREWNKSDLTTRWSSVLRKSHLQTMLKWLIIWTLGKDDGIIPFSLFLGFCWVAWLVSKGYLKHGCLPCWSFWLFCLLQLLAQGEFICVGHHAQVAPKSLISWELPDMSSAFLDGMFSCLRFFGSDISPEELPHIMTECGFQFTKWIGRWLWGHLDQPSHGTGHFLLSVTYNTHIHSQID